MSRRHRAATVYVESRRAGPVVYLDSFAVTDRGRGLGCAAYEKWERALPPGVERVVLDAVDDSVGFWQKMGFSFLYRRPSTRLQTTCDGLLQLASDYFRLSKSNESCSSGVFQRSRR